MSEGETTDITDGKETGGERAAPSLSQLSMASLSAASPFSSSCCSINLRKRSTGAPESRMFRFFSASRKKYSYDCERRRGAAGGRGQTGTGEDEEEQEEGTRHRAGLCPDGRLTSVKYSILYMSFLKKQTSELR